MPQGKAVLFALTFLASLLVLSSIATAQQSAPAGREDDDWLDHPHFLIEHRPVGDARTPALRVDLATVEVHHVEWVQFHCTPYTVSRHRYEKHEPDF